MSNFLECNYLFRNLNSTENPSIEIAPKDPNSNSELWVFIRCASLAKKKKYQFIAFTKGFDIILKNNYENGFVVVSTIDLINNIDTEMIHDCSTREKVYKEANKTIQRQRSEEWYKIAANYAVRSKEVDIERVSIPPHCYFYVSCEEVLAMNYENIGKVIDENDENKCNKLLKIILNNHFIGEWNAPSKISAEKEEYSKMLEDMIEIDTQFKSKRLSTGYEDVSFKERFIKVLEKIDLRYQKKADEKAEPSIEEYKQKLLGNAYEKFKVFERKYLSERSHFSTR